MFDPHSLVVEVDGFAGKRLEQLIAPSSGRVAHRPDGVVVAATYAASEPGLLGRLRDLQVQWAIDPQSMRFATNEHLAVASVARLPYAPLTPLDSGRWTPEHARMVEGALRFQARFGPAYYLVPALPYDRLSPAAFTAQRSLHEHAFSIVGSAEVPSRPLVAFAAASPSLLKSPFAITNCVSNRPFAGLHLQLTSLDARDRAVESLVGLVGFLRVSGDEHVPALVGRAGAFGLVLAALGVSAFAMGIGDKETSSLSGLKGRRQKEGEDKRAGGRAARVYLPALFRSFSVDHVRILVRHKATRPHFLCEGCETVESLLENRLEHWFHAREQELRELRHLPTIPMRTDHMRQRLLAAIELAKFVNRTLGDDGQKQLELSHLERWLAVLERADEQQLRAAS